MSRRKQDKFGGRESSPCPACGGRNRPGDGGCYDCYWDEWLEAMEKPDEVVNPNYVSFNEAQFIKREFGVPALKKASTSGTTGMRLRERYRAIMKEADANHA